MFSQYADTEQINIDVSHIKKQLVVTGIKPGTPQDCENPTELREVHNCNSHIPCLITFITLDLSGYNFRLL